MNKFKDFIFNRFYFLSAFLVTSLLATIPFLFWVQSINKVFIIWGAIIIVKDLFTKRLMLSNKGKLFLWLLSISYILTSILNVKYISISNITAFIYFALHYMIMTSYDLDVDKNFIKKQIILFSRIYIYFTFIMSIISLLMFVINFSKMYNVDGTNYFVGIFEKVRLQGLFFNPNVSGVTAFISIAFSIMNIINTKEQKNKISKFYIINIILCVLCLILSLSRSATVCLLVFSIILIMSISFIYLKNKSKKVNLRIFGLAILSGFIVFSTITTTSDIVKDVMPYSQKAYFYIKSSINKLKDKGNNADETKPDEIVLKREDYDDNSNGRFELWEAGVDVWLDNPVFGVGFQKGVERAKELDVKHKDIPVDNFHNIYVESLAGFGLIGFIGVMSYFIMIISKSIIFVFKVKKINYETCFILILIATLAAFFVNGIFEMMLFSPGGFASVPFWGLLGFTTYYLEKHAMENGYYKPSVFQKLISKRKDLDIKSKGE